MASVIESIPSDVFENGSERHNELKEKLSALKVELEENVEEDKRVVDIRKTLKSVGPLLENVEALKVERKSTLKRSLAEDNAEARFSKRARNSIWVTKDRLSNAATSGPGKAHLIARNH